MATLTLEIPDALLRDAEARLGGRAHIAQRLLSFLQVLADEGEALDADTQAKLLEGLNSPAGEMAATDWCSLRQRIESHRKP